MLRPNDYILIRALCDVGIPDHTDINHPRELAYTDRWEQMKSELEERGDGRTNREIYERGVALWAMRKERPVQEMLSHIRGEASSL